MTTIRIPIPVTGVSITSNNWLSYDIELQKLRFYPALTSLPRQLSPATASYACVTRQRPSNPVGTWSEYSNNRVQTARAEFLSMWYSYST